MKLPHLLLASIALATTTIAVPLPQLPPPMPLDMMMPQPHYQHDPVFGTDMSLGPPTGPMPPPPPPSPMGPPEMGPPDVPLEARSMNMPMDMPMEMNMNSMGPGMDMGMGMGNMPNPNAMMPEMFGAGDEQGMDGTYGIASKPQCQTICDFQKTVIKPEQMTVAIPQGCKYEQYLIPAPPGSCCPPTYGVRPVPQPPLLSTCVQYRKETIPMRAQFASEPCDNNFLNALDPNMAEAVVPDDGQPVGQYDAPLGSGPTIIQPAPPAIYHPPVKTCALD